MRLSRVDLPEPEAPMMATYDPGFTTRFTPRNARTSAHPPGFKLRASNGSLPGTGVGSRGVSWKGSASARAVRDASGSESGGGAGGGLSGAPGSGEAAGGISEGLAVGAGGAARNPAAGRGRV